MEVASGGAYGAGRFCGGLASGPRGGEWGDIAGELEQKKSWSPSHWDSDDEDCDSFYMEIYTEATSASPGLMFKDGHFEATAASRSGEFGSIVVEMAGS